MLGVTTMSDNNSRIPGESDHYFAPPSIPKNTDYRHARPARFVGWRPPAQREAAAQPHPAEIVDPRQIIVVGVCSAGKSTLVRALRGRGYKVRACAQEHSGVPYLWQRSR